MTASQKTANPNGCAEPTKKDDDGIDTNIAKNVSTDITQNQKT